MEQTNITDLRKNLPAKMRRVARGERSQITIRGQMLARLEADLDDAARAMERLRSYRAFSSVGDILQSEPSPWTK